MNEVINFLIDALARNENLLEERKVAIVIIHFAFDEAADLIASRWAGNNVRQVIGDWFHLLTNPIFYECRRLGRKHFGKRRVRAGEITETIADELAYICFKVFVVN